MLALEEKNKIQEKLEKLNKITKICSLIRLILALIIIFFIICLISLHDYILYGLLGAGFALIMIIFIICTNKYYHEIKLAKHLEYIYKKHENRRNMSYKSFSDDGREFIKYDDYKELDLDLLGPKSLFQYLNIAKSNLGRKMLATQLTNPEPKPQEFTNCVEALAKTEESFKLESAIANISSEAKECDNDELLGVINHKIKIPQIGIILMIASYLLLVVLLVVFLIQGIPPYFLLFFIVFNYLIASRYSKNPVFSLNSSKYSDLLNAYYVLVYDILETNIDDPYFNSKKAILEEELPSLKILKKNFEILSYRKNIIFSLFGNGICYSDYIIAWRFNNQLKKLKSIKQTLDSLAEIELMLSLATIGIDNDVYCKPSQSVKISIKGGYHPLIKNCVANSLDFNGGIILTGSNMSGKTTFMRMVGVNQILANAGGLVCAERFATSNYEVVTSLRANDQLQEGISTFYAEINRMKSIMATCKEKKTLVLIDEIFKGTNANDRIFASKEIIKKLNTLSSNFIITTHDFELCECPNILNYHFDEQYKDDKIYFEFTIKKGKCQKTNAIYLLRMSGVLDNQE